jgi:tRNA A37 N6-isopentenylltransferase MiaA
VLQIGITWPREALYQRIDNRVDERFEEGMLEEIIGLLNSGVDPEWLVGLGGSTINSVVLIRSFCS